MLKFLFAVVLLPTAALVVAEAAKSFWVLASNFGVTAWFTGGFALYCAVHWFLFKSARLYVLAHELTHAFAAWISGYQVKDIAVGKEGGSVTLSGANAFVALAPYCVPLYALGAAAVYAACSLQRDMSPYRNYFLPALGFLIAFHVLHTFETVYAEKQSDLRKAGGVVFSAAIILLANGLMLLLSFRLLYPQFISVRASGRSVYHGTAAFWRKGAGLAAKAYDAAVHKEQPAAGAK